MNDFLSKERLEKIVSWRETYGAEHNVVIPAAEAEEMASELLQYRSAAENPVAEIRCMEDMTLRVENVADGFSLGRHKVFTAPPVVPDEMVYDPDVDIFDVGFMNGWNSCRAAMLKSAGGEPVSNPDTLPSTQITEGDITRIMQNSWNEYCDDTGCCPDDFRVDSGTGYLEFETGAWANLVAKRIISKLRQRSGNTGELSNG